jgi:hypothetical protein
MPTVVLQTVAACITAECSIAEIGSLHYCPLKFADSGSLIYCQL